MADFLNVCRFNPNAGGTTDWTYSSAVTGYQSPAAAGVVNGRTYKYRAESSDLSQWEIGEGTYNTGTGVLARTTVLYNSSGTGTATGQSGAGTKINFSAAPQVFVIAAKEDLVPQQVGQLPGTTTNDNASSGNVGEYFETGSGNNNASATITVTIASPAVVTWTGHGFTVGAATTAVQFTTTGALPTGITAGTTYYVKAIDANTFNIATSAANALAGTFINTSGSQSGTHTGDIRVVVTSATPQNLAAFTLGVGDWDVGGQVLSAASSTSTLVSYMSGNLATVSASTDRKWGRRLSIEYSNNTLAIGNTEFTVFNLGPARFSLSASTTIYVVGTHNFSAAGMVSSGWAWARRAR